LPRPVIEVKQRGAAHQGRGNALQQEEPLPTRQPPPRPSCAS
jgi:hypothetical protein